MTDRHAAVPAVPSGVGPSLVALARDRGARVAGAVLLVLAALAWVGVVLQAVGMGDAGHTSGAMLPGAAGTPGDAAMFTLMWGVMMAAMMLPSAIPMIALYGLVSRGTRAVPTWVFAGAYLLVWLLVGVPVYLSSVGIAAVAEAGGGGWLPYGLAAVLVASGAYQFSPIKRVCLKKCQGPLDFLMSRWRSGHAATLRLGLAHAGYCVGCCWGLMTILVAAGAMSLPWVLLIAVVVFAEKLLPRAEQTVRVVGGTLVVLGLAVAIRPDLAIALRGQPLHSMTPMPMPMTPMGM